MKVLVVDDELPILEAVAYNLRKEGYETLTAIDAERCLALASSENPDLIILDVMLPSASGFDICRRLRVSNNVPIIMLTARAEETDRVVGLELGADDYITKPFSMRELMVRVKTVLRRTAQEGDGLPSKITVGDLLIDTERHEVRMAGRLIELSPKEYQLLVYMADNPDRPFTRQTLLDRVWGADAYIGEKTVDVHIRWLREKLETNPSEPLFILTVRGTGYKLRGES
jgi:DNA-binding response OmpR family regulator